MTEREFSDRAAMGHDVDADAVRGLVGEVSDLRQSARRELQAGGWRWMLVWALVCLGAGISGFTGAADWYWLAAVPIGLVATAGIAARFDRRASIRRRAWPYWCVGAAIAVLDFGASMSLPAEAIVIVVWVVFDLGFAALAAFERQYPTVASLCILAGAVVVVGVVVDDTLGAYPYIGLGHGVVLAAVALGVWRPGRR